MRDIELKTVSGIGLGYITLNNERNSGILRFDANSSKATVKMAQPTVNSNEIITNDTIEFELN